MLFESPKSSMRPGQADSTLDVNGFPKFCGARGWLVSGNMQLGAAAGSAETGPHRPSPEGPPTDAGRNTLPSLIFGQHI